MSTLMDRFMKVTGITIRKKEKVDISTLTVRTTRVLFEMITVRDKENLPPRLVPITLEIGRQIRSTAEVSRLYLMGHAMRASSRMGRRAVRAVT